MFNRGGMVLCCGVGLVMFLQSDAEYSSRCRATESVRRLPAAFQLPQIIQSNTYHDDDILQASAITGQPTSVATMSNHMAMASRQSPGVAYTYATLLEGLIFPFT
jgi:hypothetical protein